MSQDQPKATGGVVVEPVPLDLRCDLHRRGFVLAPPEDWTEGQKRAFLAAFGIESP
jgi:hypothetical protein